MVHGIGLFHVHGHQDACNARYSLTYIKGAGIASGEILESLWAVVNEVARATSTMTLAHRVEILDAIFEDSNWKKMLKLGELLRPFNFVWNSNVDPPRCHCGTQFLLYARTGRTPKFNTLGHKRTSTYWTKLPQHRKGDNGLSNLTRQIKSERKET